VTLYCNWSRENTNPKEKKLIKFLRPEISNFDETGRYFISDYFSLLGCCMRNMFT
jgi:hypothetical protein